MCLQYPMYKVSQLGAAEPRGVVKPAASATGEKRCRPHLRRAWEWRCRNVRKCGIPTDCPRFRGQRGAHAPQLASGRFRPAEKAFFNHINNYLRKDN